jgi:cell wall-associated NlpC family hydrolase
MPVQPSLRARTTVLLALLVSLLGLSAVGATPASAYARGDRAVAIAANQKGDPYRYGAVGPNAFDCSGLTKFVYAKLGKYLPHSSKAQYSTRYVTRLARADKKPGDLVFMHRSGSIYHVGIYAGSGKWWVAPKTGDVVKLQTLYSSSYYVGRVK